jgi:aspartate racemase
MSVKVLYRGYSLDFNSLPTPDKILESYENLRRAVCAGINTNRQRSIPLASRSQDLPLSFIQESLWLREQMEETSAAYNLSAAVRLSGRLDTAALNRSIADLVRRHEILRTVFPTTNGLPRQVIKTAFEAGLKMTSVPNGSLAEIETAIQRTVQQEASAIFDLENGPLFRAHLLELSAEDHVLVMIFHHLVYDAWSASILLRDLAGLYEAHANGKESPLPELPLQYADFAVWQRESLNNEVLQKALTYWKDHLAGAPSLLELPTDFPRAAIPAPAGTRYPFRFSHALTAKLKELAKLEKVTLFTLMLTVFQLLLAKLSRQDDVVVGIPVAGRTHVDLEGVIGCFINILPVRTKLPGRLSFRSLLPAVQSATRKIVTYQDVPFEKIIEAVAPARSASGSPIYQVLFDFINTPPQETRLSSLTMSPVTVDTGAAKMDLLVDVWEAEQQLVGQFEYRTALFTSETIAAFANFFQILSSSIVARPDSSIADLPIYTHQEDQKKMATRSDRKELNRAKLKMIRPKSISV